MPPELPSGRKRACPRPVSCNFCRSRKLRCSREVPCINCTSRGIPCEFPGLQSSNESQPASTKESDPISLQILDRIQRLEDIITHRNIDPNEPRQSSPGGACPKPLSQSSELDEPSIPLRIKNIATDAHRLEKDSRSHGLSVSVVCST